MIWITDCDSHLATIVSTKQHGIWASTRPNSRYFGQCAWFSFTHANNYYAVCLKNTGTPERRTTVTRLKFVCMVTLCLRAVGGHKRIHWQASIRGVKLFPVLCLMVDYPQAECPWLLLLMIAPYQPGRYSFVLWKELIKAEDFGIYEGNESAYSNTSTCLTSLMNSYNLLNFPSIFRTALWYSFVKSINSFIFLCCS